MSKNSTQCSSVVSQVVKLVSVFVFNKCVGGTKYGERGPGRHLPGPAARLRLTCQKDESWCTLHIITIHDPEDDPFYSGRLKKYTGKVLRFKSEGTRFESRQFSIRLKKKFVEVMEDVDIFYIKFLQCLYVLCLSDVMFFYQNNKFLYLCQK